MAASTALEVLGTGRPDGTRLRGLHRELIIGVGATRTLLPKESGAMCMLDSASGNVYTLPTPVEGMQFEFFQSATVTTNAAKVITSASSFLLGEVFTYTTATITGAGFAFNGSSHVAISMNGSTTGGVIGTRFIVTALSTTQWLIQGLIVGSSTLATPAATS